MKRILLLMGILFFISGTSFGQAAGDIAFIAFNADGDDDFAIVVLNTLPDTVIHFSDRDWNGVSFDGGEGTLFWDTGGSVAQGTVVVFTDVDSDGNANFGASVGSLTDTGSLNLSVSGDAIWAFVTNGVDDTTFVAAITNEDAEFVNIGSTGLTSGTNAFDLSDGAGTPDGGVYTGSRLNSLFGNFGTAINTFSNWAEDNDDGEVFLPFNTTSFATSSTVTVSGDAGWRMLSLPVTSGTVEEISDDTAVQGIDGGSNTSEEANFYINTASDGTSGNGFSEPTNVSTAWGDGLGFILYFFDNTSAGSSELPIDLDADGTEPGSDVTVSLSNTYTLLGNPFTSNLELDQVVGDDTGVGVSDGLVSPVSMWNDGTSSYETFNIGEGLEVAAWQGFFVQRFSSSTTEVTIPVLAKTDSAADASVFSKEKPADWRRINLSLVTEGYQDNSNKLYFKVGSHEGKDGFDGSKLNSLNGSPTLAFIQDFGDGEELLVQDARAFELTDEQKYRLSIQDNGISGDYTISWSEWKNIPQDWTVELKDLKTNEIINLRDSDSYSFELISKSKKFAISILSSPITVASGADQTIEPRFEITISPTTSVNNEEEGKVTSFALSQNYPNPFNPTTTINYSVENAGQVTISVYNLMGQKVAELVNESKAAGSYNVTWNAANAASGMYYYRLESGGQTMTRKMTLIK